MIPNYTQSEINQIMLSKKLDDFYLAIIENRQQVLTDEEYEEIKKREMVITGDSKGIEGLFNKFKTNKNFKKIVPELTKFLYGLSQIRYMAILTMIDGEVYDAVNSKFISLNRNKIIHFDKLTNYYNENNARVKIFTPQEAPQLKYARALIDVDDESIVQTYEKDHINQEESLDLTSNFFIEFKEKNHILTRVKKD